MTTVLVAAAGVRAGWKKHDMTQHLVEINGESVLRRICRMVRERDEVPIVVLRPKQKRLRSHVEGAAEVFLTEDVRCFVATVLSSRPIWTEQNIILPGDVVYTDATMDKLFSSYSGFCRVVGRQYLQTLGSINLRPEMFGLSFGSRSVKKVVQALDKAIKWAESSHPPWGHFPDFVRAYQGIPWKTRLPQMEFRGSFWVEIGDDPTVDVDRPNPDFEILNLLYGGNL